MIIKSNTIDGTGFANDNNTGLALEQGSTTTVTNNVVTNVEMGIYQSLNSGSISNNTFSDSLYGIWVAADDISVTGNKISAGNTAIFLNQSSTALSRNPGKRERS